MNLKDHIRTIKDYPKKGILFRDITTLIKNNDAFTHTIDLMVENSKNFGNTTLDRVYIPSFDCSWNFSSSINH